MPEDVRDLVVRLSFQHGDTKSQISAIRNEIKLLETDFRAAAAGAGGLSAGMNQTAARAGTLEKQIELQRQAVEKYGTAIEEAQQSIQKAIKRQEDYGTRLEKAKAQHAELTEQIKQQKKALDDASGRGVAEDSDEYKALKADLDALNEALEKNEKEIKTLESGYARADTSIANADKRVQSLTIAQNQAREALSQMEGELEKANERLKTHADALEAAGQKLTAYGERASRAGQAQEKLGSALSKGSAAVAAAGAAAAGAAISWESSFAGVQKTVNGTAEELDAIEEALLDMGENKSAGYGDLADIAANAGQLGIATQNVVSFTGVMADLAETTDLTADSASSSFAQFANITGMAQTNFDRLGSVAVELGNNMATTESKIVDMATRIASAGTQANMTEAQIFGLAAGLSSLGLEAEAGGTAASTMLSRLQVAVETGNEELEQFAAVAGMSATQFAQAFRQDAAGAFTAFLQGLSSGSESAIVTLENLGITETRLRDTLLRASNASELMTTSIEMANQAWQENTALTKEASVRYGTTASRMQMLGNKTQRVAIQFGNSLLPALEKGMDALDDIVEKFASLDEEQRSQILTWGAYAAAAGPAIKLIGKANSAIGGLSSKIGGFAKSLATSGVSAGSLLSGISGLLGPAGIAAVAAGAGYAAYKFIDWASGAAAAREAMERLNEVAQEWAETNAQTIYDTGNTDPLARFGMSEGDFSTSLSSAQSWMDQLMQVWTDGEVETDAQVEQFVGAFTEASDAIREKIQSQSNTAEAYGVTLSEDAKAKMEEDLATLDAYDAEIEALLNKRQGGFLTEEEQARLNEVIQLRAELELEYSGGDGYDQIITNMQAEVARLQASGEADATVFGDTLNALAQGREAYNQALAESYNAEYAQISAIDDEAARLAALEELNARYNQKRLEGEQAYQQAVREAGSQTWEANAEGFDAQVQQIQALAQALGDTENLDFGNIAALTEGLDEGQLASMLALIEQLKASGMSDEEIFAETGVNATELLSTIQQIRDTASEIEGLEPLSEIFGGSLPEEVTDILIGLDMTQAAADWEAFAEGKDPWEIEGTVKVELSPLDQAAIDAWNAANAGVELEGPPARVGLKLGDDWKSDLVSAFNQGKLAVYGEDGLPLEVTPEVLEALDGNDIVMGVDENGVYHVTVVPDSNTPEGAFAQADFELGSRTSLIDVPSDYAGRLRDLAQSINDYNYAIQNGETGNASAYATEIEEIGEALSTGLSAEDGAGFETVAQYVANGLELLNQGKLSEGQAEELLGIVEQLQTILDFDFSQVSTEMEETGANISAGIAQGFTAYGWENDAQAVASSLKGAVDAAFLVGSPSQLMVPTGGFVAAGIGQGMGQYDFTADSALLVGNLQSAIGAALGTGEGPAAGMASIAAGIPAGIGQGLAQYSFWADAALLAANLRMTVSALIGAQTLAPNGSNAAAGIAQGMTSYSFSGAAQSVMTAVTSPFASMQSKGYTIGANFGQGLYNGLKSKMASSLSLARQYANQITATFQKAWDQHSPSRVARHLTEMFGAGLEQGMADWPVVSERLLDGDILDARRGVEQVVNNTTDSRNFSTSSTINVERLQVHDEQDIRSLAIEIANLARRQQRGRGIL